MLPSHKSDPSINMHKKNDSKETDSSDFLIAAAIGKNTLQVHKRGSNESDLSTPNSSDKSGNSNNSAVSFRSNVQMIKNVSSAAINRLETKTDGAKDLLLMKMKSKVIEKIEGDENKDDVDPIKIIEVADEARDELF